MLLCTLVVVYNGRCLQWLQFVDVSSGGQFFDLYNGVQLSMCTVGYSCRCVLWSMSIVSTICRSVRFLDLYDGVQFSTCTVVYKLSICIMLY